MSAYTCYQCGKGIAGKMVNVQPSIIAMQLGDFAKAFHPACHVKAEKKAAQDLGIPFRYQQPA